MNEIEVSKRTAILLVALIVAIIAVLISYALFVPPAGPVDTTTVIIGRGTAPDGTIPSSNVVTLIVRTSTTGNRRSVIKFNLSEIPPNAHITQATLSLYCMGRSNMVENVTDVEACEVYNDSWSELSRLGTIENPPQEIGDVLDTQTPVIWTWRHWDVTSFAQSEFDDDKVMSLCLKSKVEDYDSTWRYSGYWSKEYGALQPYLTVTYEIRPLSLWERIIANSNSSPS